MNTAELNAMEHLFLTLGDKTRLRLLSLMAAGPVSVGHLVDSLGESQPKVSRHLAYMRQSGIVTTQRDGKWIYYMLSEPTEPEVAQVLNSVISVLTMNGPTTSHQLAPHARHGVANEPAAEEFIDELMPDEIEIYNDIPAEDYEGSARQELEVYLL